MARLNWTMQHRSGVKEVIVTLQIDQQQPVIIVVPEQAFLAALDHIRNDAVWDKYIKLVTDKIAQRDKPDDELKFNPEDWEGYIDFSKEGEE